MKFRAFIRSRTFRTLIVFGSLFMMSWSILSAHYWLLFFIVPLVIWQFYSFLHAEKRAVDELDNFIEGVKYHDFTRHYDEKSAPASLIPFRKSFNQLNEKFRMIGRERETQYLYLKTILEFIDTGILSYNIQTKEVLWMNEALKQLLGIPYMKTIAALEKRNTELFGTVSSIEPGNNVLTTVPAGKTTMKLLLTATSFRAENKDFKLISFQNISEAIDVTEADAWKKLLSVMTHEIMNSVAPISSLAATLNSRVDDLRKDGNEQIPALEDLETGLATIQSRSDGLLKFTETYRKLGKVNKAVIKKTPVAVLLQHVHQLFLPVAVNRNITLELIIKDPMAEIDLDPDLIEQAVINLVTNAMDAVIDRQDPTIRIEERTEGGRISVRVADNGSGIDPDLTDKIFIPFFSTKKSGSGIGLNLCKQIMILHKGTITVDSRPGEGTVFSLNF